MRMRSTQQKPAWKDDVPDKIAPYNFARYTEEK